MVGSVEHQPSLFYAAFERQAALIKDDLLEPVDQLLDDPSLVQLVRQALAGRRQHSRRTGRKGMAPDRLLRCCALKHIKQWSLRDLEREIRSSLLYRHFTRYDQEPIPDFSTLSRNFALLDPETTRQIHLRIVSRAQRQRIAAGRKLRSDTTVVETNVHHPTDSSLLGDGIRVLTRSLKRIAAECRPGALAIVDHARSAQRRILEIHRAARTFTDGGKARLQSSYSKLVSLARGVVRQSEKTVDDLATGKLAICGSGIKVLGLEALLRHFVPLVKKVVAQTKARVFGGNTHVVGKVLSLFEEHTQVIRKGKAHKPNEFGRLVRIDEVDNGIVSNYEVAEGNPSDEQQFLPAVSQHRAIFGRPPRMATADRGYSSARNEREAHAQGVEQVVLPARGKLPHKRARLQKQRWFRRGLRWRGGIESRIATLKHRFGMVRATYKGEHGFKRAVGWAVITNNLVSIARVLVRRRRKAKDHGSNTPSEK
jgi:IS5 family transposase